jgi:hypothetical protein
MERWLVSRCRHSRHIHLTALDGFDQVLIAVLEDSLALARAIEVGLTFSASAAAVETGF